MTFGEIASVNGKGGLFKVLKTTKTGLILESLDEHKNRMMATATHKVSLLSEISIYTHSKEGTVALPEVLKSLRQKFGDTLSVNPSSTPAELKDFLKSALPNYDEDKVYVSDIKKLVKWYGLLVQHAPELIAEAAPAAEKEKKKDSQSSAENHKKL